MDTSAAQQSTSATATAFGTMSAGWIALFVILAVIVIAAIVAGMRLKRKRKAGQRSLAARREAAGAPTAPVIHTTTPTAPSPPPLADEPVVAAAPLDASPAALAADADTPPAEPAADASGEEDIALLKGIGPKLVARLGELGITRNSQIAALTPDQATTLDSQLGAFTGRMHRDRWIDQARYLASGDRAGFEAEFGKL
jgi:predicted flap endonuclease-1-like 5' DNA nuclease